MTSGAKLMAAAAVTASMSAFGSGHALADCATRHFYNHSNVPWILIMGDNAGKCSDGPDGNKPVCTFRPGQYGEIHYAGHFATTFVKDVVVAAVAAATKNAGVLGKLSLPPKGSIKIVSQDARIYPGESFKVDTSNPTTCYLEHNGNTGNVVLNDPASGDIQTCGRRTVITKEGSYNCRF